MHRIKAFDHTRYEQFGAVPYGNQREIYDSKPHEYAILSTWEAESAIYVLVEVHM